jgi:hypothetical protein
VDNGLITMSRDVSRCLARALRNCHVFSPQSGTNDIFQRPIDTVLSNVPNGDIPLLDESVCCVRILRVA